ncbi:MAG TPA: fused MFS/spermidine synthase [Gammaproteobacteria bacterium]|nr:fused MFS/spermidine synthase [Gammaproteobacteria bacterium]
MRAVILLMILLAGAWHSAQAEIIFEKQSLYRNILVTDNGERICMRFTLPSARIQSLQSCQYKDNPNKLVFSYAKAVFAGLLIQPDPERILIAGLGGGSIPRVMHKLYPQAQIDVVEIDPAVVDVAARFFDFHEGDNIDVIERDARVFVKQMLLKGDIKYDYIILDAFNGEYIPAHLMTKEFLQECKNLLTNDGVLVANTFSTSKLYHSESATYAAVFDWFVEVRTNSGNRIILASKGKLPTVDELMAAENALDKPFDTFDIDMEEIVEQADTSPEWRHVARVLTDQYAPVNLLQGR